jgi:GNAT superfamily N-acetyltransferase
MITVRLADSEDIEDAGRMIGACMTELFGKRWSGTTARLAADLSAGRVRIALAVAERPIGLIAWNDDYDIHHCVTGGTTCELYVEPAYRGRAIAAKLIAFACREIERGGGVFIKGTAVASAAPLYDRIAWGWDCREVILGGRAFRTLAGLVDATPRQLVRSLPDPAWNHEP